MSPKSHGTTEKPVMKNLRWNCDWDKADRYLFLTRNSIRIILILSVCCFNRHYAEESGYFAKTNFLNEESGEKEITFYDSVSGKPLYIAPRGRTWKEFVIESKV